MKPLRAFLCFRDAAGVWTTSAFRDLDALLEAWRDILGAGTSGAAIHVGFWRPDTLAMAALAELHPGLLILSEAALYALPGSIAVSKTPVGAIGNLVFRLAVSGFGYDLPGNAAPISAGGGTGTTGVSCDPRGWVGDLSMVNPALAGVAASAGIWDDQSYSQFERGLEFDSRQMLGEARFILLTGTKPNEVNILDNIRACPAWFRSILLDRITLSVRQKNVFAAHGIATVDDVGRLGTSGLLKLPALGRKSVRELAFSLHRLLLDGPVASILNVKEDDDPVSVPEQVEIALVTAPAPRQASCIRDLIVNAAQSLNHNERRVLNARMGFGCPRLTLQEISDTAGVTRERIRQIEVKVCKRLGTQNRWLEIEQRITALLADRTTPLLLDGLPALDPWFEGLANPQGPIEFIFDRFLERRLHVLDVGGLLCISRLSNDDWESELRSAKRMLEGSVPDRLLEAEARHLVESLLVGPGEELRGDLWAVASRAARFADLPDGTRRLVGYGKSAEAVVHAILWGSSIPLHYSEIHRLAASQNEDAIELRRIHAAAASVGVLFARGTYGLPHHNPLRPSEVEMLRAEVEDMMYGEAADRQWHCMELCDALLERGLGFDERLSKYVVNMTLKGAPRLAYLGRLVWGLADSWQESASSRIDVRQAVISLLEREGRPLTTSEIRSRLEMERGVNVHFQIHPTEPLVRVGPGEWGLMHRDLKLDVESANDVLCRLQERLRVLERGIHLSEVGDDLSRDVGGSVGPEINPYWISTLARRSGLRIDKGQYLYLEEWGNSRRLSIQDSVQTALEEWGSTGALLDDICARANQLSLRQCSRQTISQALQAVGALFDPLTDTWTSNAETIQFEPDEV